MKGENCIDNNITLLKVRVYGGLKVIVFRKLLKIGSKQGEKSGFSA